MEAASLAVGIIPLFKTCVEISNIVETAQNFAEDYFSIHTTFLQQLKFFEDCLERIGGSDPYGTTARQFAEATKQAGLHEIVMKTLAAIKLQLKSFKEYEKKYGPKNDPPAGVNKVNGKAKAASIRSSAKTKEHQRGRSVGTRTMWAVSDAERMKEIVENLKSQIAALLRFIETVAKSTQGAKIRPQQAASARLIDVESWLTDQIKDTVPQITAARLHDAPSLLSMKADDGFDDADGETALPSRLTHESKSIDVKHGKSSRKTIQNTAPSRESSKRVLRQSPWEAFPRRISSRTFTNLFPSSGTIYIRHDTIMNENMELQIFTSAHREPENRTEYMSLFHLVMQDLPTRKFSLRKHCRDGPEVCCSSMDPNLHKGFKMSDWTDRLPLYSLSNLSDKVLTMTENAITYRDHHGSSAASIHSTTIEMSEIEQRQPRPQSARTSISSWVGRARSLSSHRSASGAESCDDTRGGKRTVVENKEIKLDFLNEEEIVLVRKGSKEDKQYIFEYGGTKYVWKRIYIDDLGKGSEANWFKHSFRLYYSGGRKEKKQNEVLAQLRPAEEHEQYGYQDADWTGAWVPKAVLKLRDDRVERDKELAT